VRALATFQELELHVTAESKAALTSPLSIQFQIRTCLSEAHFEAGEVVDEAPTGEDGAVGVEAHRAVEQRRLSGQRRRIFWI